MKRGQLRSIAHSLADSIASGFSLMTGFYQLDLFGDAANSPNGLLSVNLLDGTITEGTASPELAAAVSRLGVELDRLCSTAGISRDQFKRLEANFFATVAGGQFTLTIEDCAGGVTETDYEGSPAHRVLETDQLGRIRRRPIRRSGAPAMS